MSDFYNKGAYMQNDKGYVISKGSIPSSINHKYISVWSAFNGLPPDGMRIMNGDNLFFYSQRDAENACLRHMEDATDAQSTH